MDFVVKMDRVKYFNLHYLFRIKHTAITSIISFLIFHCIVTENIDPLQGRFPDCPSPIPIWHQTIKSLAFQIPTP